MQGFCCPPFLEALSFYLTELPAAGETLPRWLEGGNGDAGIVWKPGGPLPPRPRPRPPSPPDSRRQLYTVLSFWDRLSCPSSIFALRVLLLSSNI